MSKQKFSDPYICKVVPHKYDGVSLKFNLSYGLFSSFSIDAGTMLLLKTIAQHINLEKISTVLDTGCGVGVIGLSLKKRHPHLELLLTDRDALALYFTRSNAKLNKIKVDKGLRIESGILPGSYIKADEKKHDIIISNIPAKAGNDAIQDFISGCHRHLNPGGITAVVIVSPLSDLVESTINACRHTLLYQEKNEDYTVFHFIPRVTDFKDNETQSELTPYFRQHDQVSTVYGLPNFDNLSFALKSALSIQKANPEKGTILFWQPGQGHISSFYKTSEVILSGRDLLQLKISAYNLEKQGNIPSLLHRSKLGDLTEDLAANSIDRMILEPVFVSGTHEEIEIISTAHKLLKKNGDMLIYGKSSNITRITGLMNCFSIIASKKDKGFCSILLRKTK